MATRIGGLTDSILDGKTGILVNPSDPKSLAEGILRILRDPISARKYGVAGRARMLGKFTLRRTVEDLASLYSRQCGRRRVGYRRHVIRIRLLTGSILCLLIVLRYMLIDFIFCDFGIGRGDHSGRRVRFPPNRRPLRGRGRHRSLCNGSVWVAQEAEGASGRCLNKRNIERKHGRGAAGTFPPVG